MRLNNKDIGLIKEKFNKLREKQDFLDLLNYAKSLIYGDRFVAFELKHLNYHSNPKANSTRYKKFEILKKSGGVRVIYAPNRGLKALQTCLNLILQTVYPTHTAATGFIPGKSILDNARIHSGTYMFTI